MGVSTRSIWIFSLWYFNWSGPITAGEVDEFMEVFNNAEGSQHTDAEVFRKLLEQDDGGEFLMLNLVQLHDSDVAHPITGEQMPAMRLLNLVELDVEVVHGQKVHAEVVHR